MSATQSFLASPSYGYDFVVATTQTGVNTVIRRYLKELSLQDPPVPPVTVCYVAGPDGAPQEIGYDDLKSRAQGSDPFAVSPDADPRTDPDLFNLAKAGFMMGFQAEIGMPPGVSAKTVNFVTLGSTANSVTYSLYCSVFEVAQLGAGASTWLRVSQQSGAPWIFTAAVDLRLSAVPGDAFNTLPADVQKQIKNLSGSAFSVQQLLFDLNNARLMSVPQISGIPENAPVYKVLQEYFVGAYFGAMKKAGQPVLGVAVTQPTKSASTLAPTDLTIGVSPYVGTPADPDLSCLTYLCATDGHTLPAPQPFSWNWVDEAEAAGCDGVVSVSRTALQALLLKQMLPTVKANCYLPSVRVTLNAMGPVYDLKPIGGQDPQVIDTTCLDFVIVDNPNRPPHFQILRFAYDASASDQAGPNGSSGGASMDTHYLALVATAGNQLWISQSLTINMSVRKYQSTTTGTPVNIQRIDECVLDVDAFGQITSSLTTLIPPSNHATTSDVNFGQDLFTMVNELYGDAAALVTRMAGTLVDAIPFGTAQAFVFPGGQTFANSSAGFSAHGDLVSHLKYADPDQVPPGLLAGPVLPPGQVAGTDHLLAGEWIPNDGYLISASKQYAAVLQDDGNLVLVYCTNGGPDLGRPFWSWAANKPALKVGTFTGTPCFATMQADGNFLLYNGRSPIDPGSPYWATQTPHSAFGPFFAVMQNDRNFVVYSGVPDAKTGVLFATNTNI